VERNLFRSSGRPNGINSVLQMAFVVCIIMYLCAQRGSFMSSKLMVLAGPDEGTVFPLGAEVVLLGRSRATETALTDPHVSRVHWQIVLEGNKFGVVDFDSASGTFVNGKEIERHVFQTSDLIRIGATHLQYAEGG